MNNIKVLLFDDNIRIRESLSILFNATGGFEFCGAYADNMQVVELVELHQPNVVLMDIDLPGINGIEAVRRIRKTNTELPILMLTVFDDDEKIFGAICAGASGYMLKNKSLDQLIDAVREVSLGGAPMTPSIAKRVLELFQKQNKFETADDFNLSPREKDVLGHLVKGNCYKMIADELQIGYDTVHSHIKKIYKKLHVNSMTEAVAKALKNRLT